MNEPFRETSELTLTLQKWQQINPDLKVGFTTRNGGCSKTPFHSLNLGLHVPDKYEDVIENRTKLADVLEMPLERWVSGEQTHETRVHVVENIDTGKGSISYDASLKGIDGLITKEPGVLCTAFYADCVPLFFFDPVTGYIGIAHAGWKGTVNRIGKEMIRKFTSAGANPKDIQAVIGPCISKHHYEVDEKVIRHIPLDQQKNTVEERENNRFLLDLKQLNVEILLQQGILRHNIDVTNYCTFTDENLFFSHRRDQGKTGRMLGYIGYKHN
ncbi:peptidoglycan editing factor PgeF [Virgibacillus siamensis]|uniref:peptidoglycan editing factor PgeF n=1 Tax=Virgibacillus siamensis TaxID=480071 RepID=UPI0009859168|nr:peptidoglycan editing factor PgeF [Virgibacillus siamensis]